MRVSVVEQLQLLDVVLTFHMRKRVKLMATGRLADGGPGDVTVTVDESDFSSVIVTVSEEANPNPYEICTLDYSYAGRAVSVNEGPHTGKSGTILVVATIGDAQQNRVQLSAGDVVTLDGAVLSWDELPTE